MHAFSMIRYKQLIERKMECMNETIKENIRLLRKERQMTQEQLAEAMGVSGAAVSKWENGVSLR